MNYHLLMLKKNDYLYIKLPLQNGNLVGDNWSVNNVNLEILNYTIDGRFYLKFFCQTAGNYTFEVKNASFQTTPLSLSVSVANDPQYPNITKNKGDVISLPSVVANAISMPDYTTFDTDSKSLICDEDGTTLVTVTQNYTNYFIDSQFVLQIDFLPLPLPTVTISYNAINRLTSSLRGPRVTVPNGVIYTEQYTRTNDGSVTSLFQKRTGTYQLIVTTVSNSTYRSTTATFNFIISPRFSIVLLLRKLGIYYPFK